MDPQNQAGNQPHQGNQPSHLRTWMHLSDAAMTRTALSGPVTAGAAVVTAATPNKPAPAPAPASPRPDPRPAPAPAAPPLTPAPRAPRAVSAGVLPPGVALRLLLALPPGVVSAPLLLLLPQPRGVAEVVEVRWEAGGGLQATAMSCTRYARRRRPTSWPVRAAGWQQLWGAAWLGMVWRRHANRLACAYQSCACVCVCCKEKRGHVWVLHKQATLDFVLKAVRAAHSCICTQVVPRLQQHTCDSIQNDQILVHACRHKAGAAGEGRGLCKPLSFHNVMGCCIVQWLSDTHNASG